MKDEGKVQLEDVPLYSFKRAYCNEGDKLQSDIHIWFDARGGVERVEKIYGGEDVRTMKAAIVTFDRSSEKLSTRWGPPIINRTNVTAWEKGASGAVLRLEPPWDATPAARQYSLPILTLTVSALGLDDPHIKKKRLSER